MTEPSIPKHDQPPPIPRRLDYGGAGHNSHLAGLAAAAKMIAGGVVGFVAMIFVGMFSSGLAESKGEFAFHSVPLGVGYLLLAAASVVGAWYGLWHPPRRWFVAGLLIGGCAACLIDGTCYLSN
jgi:hypothetical protein